MPKGYERVIAIIIGILILVIIALSLSLLDSRLNIQQSEETLTRLHRQQITLYDNHIRELGVKITELQYERDSLILLKGRVIERTIFVVDSIESLPFEGKGEFFVGQIIKLDSTKQEFK